MKPDIHNQNHKLMVKILKIFQLVTEKQLMIPNLLLYPKKSEKIKKINQV